MIILWLSVKRDNEYDADMNWIISIWSSIYIFYLSWKKYDDDFIYFYLFHFFLKYLNRFTILLKIIQDFFLMSEYFC